MRHPDRMRSPCYDGSVLTAAREAKGLSLEIAALDAQVPEDVARAMEAGTANPGITDAFYYAEACGLDRDETNRFLIAAATALDAAVHRVRS